MCKVNSEDHQNVDYIYCLQYFDTKAVQSDFNPLEVGLNIQYFDTNAVQSNFRPLEVTDTTICCNLEQRQRSSQ